MCAIEVVELKLEHMDEIMKVENLSFTIPWSRNAFEDEVTRNKFARYVAAKYGGKVVGYAGMWKVCDEGHITNIAVHPEYRNAGIGSLLLGRLVDIARAEGVARMTLEVREGNIAAQSLYMKFGFVSEGIRKSYYADNGENAIIMWLIIS